MLPDVGDIAWVELDPVKGTEQSGRRPGLILTDREYHRRSRRSLVCPITSRDRPWPFNVRLPPGMKTKGVVLVDQLRVIDRPARMFDIIETCDNDVLADVRGVLAALLGMDALAVTGPGST